MTDKQIQEILISIDEKLGQKKPYDIKPIITSVLSGLILATILFMVTLGKIPFENQRAIETLQATKAEKAALKEHVQEDKESWYIVNNNIKTQNENNKIFQMALDNIPDVQKPHITGLDKIILNHD
jgi:lipopolysaccharide export LptBFGC system permease protein LptF